MARSTGSRQRRCPGELIAYHYREAATLGSTLRQAETHPIRARAVHWLGRAAATALAGAALEEAARHLRAAIELADSPDHPELYERLGDVHVGGDASAEAYGTALTLCREAGRPPDQELRVLAKLLTVLMRYQGSVASRPSDDTMAQMPAAKAKHLWNESNRIAAGYATRGFATALDVARARRDEKTIEELKEIIEDILQKFRAARTDAPVVLRIEPYARLNFAGLIRYVEAFSFRHR